MHRQRIDPQHELVRGHTGRGVRIAVIDSGVNPRNPHIGRITSAVAFDDAAQPAADILDRLGHGTAVTAAIQEKACDAEIHLIKVFHHSLSTTSHAIAHAIQYAAGLNVQLINLSLGTVKPHSIAPLTEAVVHAHERGAIVVAAREHDGEPWYPGSLALVAGVTLDWACARDTIWIGVGQPQAVFGASGLPRPVPGLPPERNIKGVSFAVANVTGVLACVLEQRPELNEVQRLVAQMTPA